MRGKKPIGSYILSILNSVLPPLFIIIIGGGLVLVDSDTGVKIGFLELYHSSVIGGLWLCCALSLAYYLGIRKNWLNPRWWTNLVIVILGFLMIPLVTLIVGSADVAIENASFKIGESLALAVTTSLIGFVLISILTRSEPRT